MKKLVSLILVCNIIFIYSCKKNDSGGDGGSTKVEIENEEELARSFDEVTEKSPRSEKKNEEFTVEGDIFEAPDIAYNELEVESQTKIDLLIAGGTNLKTFQNSASGWMLEVINDNNPDNIKVYIFASNGSYYVFEESTGVWEWGYWYVNKNFTKIIFDYESSFQVVWSVNDISSSTLVVSEGSDRLRFGPFSLSGVQNSNNSSMETDLGEVVSGKTWKLYSYYQYSEDSTYITPISSLCPEDTTATVEEDYYYQFFNNKSVIISNEINYPGNTCASYVSGSDTTNWNYNGSIENEINIYDPQGNIQEKWKFVSYNESTKTLVVDWFIEGEISSRDTYKSL